MVAKIFIDGEVGTTGLQIKARLEARADISLLRLDEAVRKDPAARGEMLNAADLVVLCLPDAAARDAVSMIDNPAVKVVDASTAHRTAADWVYGFPEYEAGQRDKIAAARWVTNPGCYAITAVAMLHPLVKGGLLPADFPVTVNAISGYSGGGKNMIAEFEDAQADNYSEAPFRVYALGLEHKHVPEIQRWSGLEMRPLLVPSVGRYRQGMIVQLPLQLGALPGRPTPGDVHDMLTAHYRDCRFVTVVDRAAAAAMKGLEPESVNGSNELRLHVFAHEEHGHAVVMGLLDNLGKGASGQAVQNLNIMLGLSDDAGLDVNAIPAY